MRNEQKILTQEEFSYSTAKVGDLVEKAIADNAMDCMPPAYMSVGCVQMGEPYSERWDPEMEKDRTTFATFKRVSKGVWQYCGHCFLGETAERG